MSVVCPFSKILTGQRDGTGFPGNDKNLSRDRRSGKNGKLQSLLGIRQNPEKCEGFRVEQPKNHMRH